MTPEQLAGAVGALIGGVMLPPDSFGARGLRLVSPLSDQGGEASHQVVVSFRQLAARRPSAAGMDEDGGRQGSR